MNNPQKPNLSSKLLRYGYWSWAADEPATHTCEHNHEECAVEKDGVCMEWLGNEVDKDYPVKECYPPLNMEDLWDL
jgi:hypothetical protein